MKIPYTICLISVLFFGSKAVLSKEKVIYKYKEYEKFDLGDLEVKGSIIAPGDLSVKQRRRKIFHQHIYYREHFKKELIREIKFLR